MSVIRQPSLFGVEASAPEPADLAGLLIAGGDIVLAGDAAQVSVVVGHPWRAAAIVAECGRRGLSATSVSTVTSYVGVRTAYAPALVGLARSWTDEVGRRPPRELVLDARVVRLWAMAVGHRDGASYVLPVGHADQVFRDALGAALASLGLAAQLVSRRGTGEPTFRIVGKRRMDRLVEMVGDAPRQAPADMWPS
jgi:hypothetical protein